MLRLFNIGLVIIFLQHCLACLDQMRTFPCVVPSQVTPGSQHCLYTSAAIFTTSAPTKNPQTIPAPVLVEDVMIVRKGGDSLDIFCWTLTRGYARYSLVRKLKT